MHEAMILPFYLWPLENGPPHGLILLIPPLRMRAPSPNVRRRRVTPVLWGRGLLEVADLDDNEEEEEDFPRVGIGRHMDNSQK